MTCVLVLLAGLGACTEDAPDNLGFAKRPLWTAEDVGEQTLAGTLLRDDIALVPGTDHLGGTLAAIDVRTGAARWSADDGDPLVGGDGLVVHQQSPHDPIQPIVQERPNGSWDVLIPYRSVADQSPNRPDQDADPGQQGDAEPVRYGIAAVAGDTGRVRWVSEPMLKVEDPIQSDPTIRAVAAEGGTVLVAASRQGESGTLATWALSGDTGDTRWTEQDAWPSALAGGHAIVEDTQDTDGTWLERGPDREDSTVRALDLRDGEPVWNLSGRYPQSTVDVASGDYLVARVTVPPDQRESGDSETATLLLRAGNGKVAERIGDFDLCYADGPLIACQPDQELMVFRTDLPRLETEVSEPFGDSSSWELLDVSGDTIVVSDRTGDEDRLVALDPKGTVIGEDLIAEPITMNEKYAAFCSEGLRGCGMYGNGKHSRPSVRNPDPKPSVDPLAVGESQWGRSAEHPSDEAAPMSWVNDVALTDDAVLYQGELREESLDATVVSDAATGEVRWRLSEKNASSTVHGERIQLITLAYGLSTIAETDQGWSMLLPYQSDDASGVAGLASANGKVDWTVPLGNPTDDVDIVDAQGDYAYVTVSPADADNDEDARSTQVVLDLAEPKVLWRSEQGLGARLASDTLLVSRPDGSGSGQSVTAVDLRDPGHERWTFTDQGGQPPEVRGVFDNLVLIRVADGTVVLDLESGAELARIGKSLSRCDGTRRLVACDSSVESESLIRPGAPVTLRGTEDGVAVRELRGVRSTEVNGVRHGRIFLDATEKQGYRSVDPNGVTVDTDLPGRFAGSNEQGIGLFTSGPPFSNVAWEVHRLRAGS